MEFCFTDKMQTIGDFNPKDLKSGFKSNFLDLRPDLNQFEKLD